APLRTRQAARRYGHLPEAKGGSRGTRWGDLGAAVGRREWEGRRVRDEKLYFFSGSHLAYEIAMCARMAQLIFAFQPERHTLTNALLESYALHLRNLIEFLYWEPARPDDVNAVHYVKSETAWIEARGSASETLLTAKTRADKQVA